MALVPPGVRRALRLPDSAERLARELDEEVRFHLEQRVRDLRASGMSDEDALEEARRRFGDEDDLKAYCQSIEVPGMRRTRFSEWWEGWTQDLRYGGRQIHRAPGFFLIAVITLGLGIGATTAIFSVVRGVLLKPLPYPDADRIVQVWQVNPNGNQGQFSDLNFEDLRERSRSFAAMAEMTWASPVSVSGIDEPVRTLSARVTADFFRVLGVRPILGRLFAPEELRENGAPAVVISHGFWQRSFGGQPDVIGRKLVFGDQPYTIVGVMPASLQHPVGADIWSPRELTPKFASRTAHNFLVVGRLADGVTLQQAASETDAVAQRLKTEHGDDTWMEGVALVPLREQLVGSARSTIVVLFAGSTLLLLIACANVVNLLIARLAARRTEVALRAALGAGRGRIAQQCMAEALTLSLVAVVLGIAVAYAGVKLLLLLQPGNLPRVSDVRIDWVVLAFAIGVAALAAMSIGIITAWRGTRSDLREALAQSQRTQGGSLSSERVRRGLVVTQVGLAVVLLIAAGLFARSFATLLGVDTGFEAERRVVLDVNTSGGPDAVRLYDDLFERFRSLAGVQSVGAVSRIPLGDGGGGDGTFLIMTSLGESVTMADIPRLFKDPARTGQADFRLASPGYFEAMGIPVRSGRSFQSGDVITAPHVAVISEGLARSRWPNESPIGKVVQFGNMDGDLTPFTIVGVVGDVRERNLSLDPRPVLYASYRQRPRTAWRMNFVLESAADPGPVAVASARAARAVRPDVPPRVRMLDEIVGSSVADRRFVLTIVGVFGAVSLVLAALGIYSVMAYLVTQRSRELSIRMALGAQSGEVVRMVLRQGMTLAALGLLVGVVGALAASRLIERMLFGVRPGDPLAYAGVVIALGTVAIVASWLPARRAAHAPVMDVMRG